MATKWQPESWDDDSRMDVMFAPFRPRATNSVGWDAKVKFWEGVIVKYAQATGGFCFKLDDLKVAFQRHGRIPRGLDVVLKDMQEKGKLVDASQYHMFDQGNVQQGWSMWAWRSLAKPVIDWSWGFVRYFWKSAISIEPSSIPSMQFLLVGEIQELAQTLLAAQQASSEDCSVLEFSDVFHRWSDICKTQENLGYVIGWLQKQGLVVVRFEGELKFVKFCGRDEKVASAITEQELAVINLQKQEKVLTQEIDKLTSTVEFCNEEARLCIHAGNRVKAKSCLRKKKLIEASLEKKWKALDNLASLLHRLRQSDSDARIFDTYQTGLSALKNCGLDVDRIEDVLDKMGETLDMSHEVSSALSRPVAFSDVEASQEELEAELKNLLGEEEEEEEKPRPIKDREDNATRAMEGLTLSDFNMKLPSPPKHPVVIGKQREANFGH
ncbi:unnamed protein product [Darwinula stevensoni]|uniref:Charged multivesicular body protein 7 n=1 Tax=Darwinula stevensoni TaxID=69355 RepID=A0A7R9A4L4_9CRUS|nr:unnamed protein product [Darwinula stevensoni]CAG0883632.1 unnamed protein product [Darwinula stevensoni]